MCSSAPAEHADAYQVTQADAAVRRNTLAHLLPLRPSTIAGKSLLGSADVHYNSFWLQGRSGASLHICLRVRPASGGGSDAGRQCPGAASGQLTDLDQRYPLSRRQLPGCVAAAGLRRSSKIAQA